MNKYIVILSIIIVLYFVQKYCIQSEVEKFLLTKNIIEKFGADGIADLNGLNITGNIILGDKIIITSDISGLKILDGDTGTPSNLSVNDIDISGSLIMRGGMNFTGNNNRFTNGGAILKINSGENNSVGIRSENGPLILNGSDISNKIILGGNTDILGLFTINNVAPILTKVLISNATDSPTARNINTGISSLTYPSITFSGYDNDSTTPQYANVIEFNTYVEATTRMWYVSFTPQITTEIKIRVTFFHKNLVDNQDNSSPTSLEPTFTTLAPPTYSLGRGATQFTIDITAPINAPTGSTTNYQVTSGIIPSNRIQVSGSQATITGLQPNTSYSFQITATNTSTTGTITTSSTTLTSSTTKLNGTSSTVPTLTKVGDSTNGFIELRVQFYSQTATLYINAPEWEAISFMGASQTRNPNNNRRNNSILNFNDPNIRIVNGVGNLNFYGYQEDSRIVEIRITDGNGESTTIYHPVGPAYAEEGG